MYSSRYRNRECVKEKYNDRIIIKVEDTIKALQELGKI